jgi:hypothetical protein
LSPPPRGKLTAAKSSYVCNQATSSAVNHLERKHFIRHDGVVARTAPSTTSGQSQSVLDSYCSAASERNATAEVFDVEVFRGLLTRFFTVEQVPVKKVDSPRLRELLIYLNPRYAAALLSSTSLRRYISSAYEHALLVVKSELASARTKINLSFDL